MGALPYPFEGYSQLQSPTCYRHSCNMASCSASAMPVSSSSKVAPHAAVNSPDTFMHFRVHCARLSPLSWLWQVAARDAGTGNAANIWAELESHGGRQLAPSVKAHGLGSHVHLAQAVSQSNLSRDSCSLSPSLQRHVSCVYVFKCCLDS